MLVIREEQMAMFAAGAEERFVERIVQHLQKFWPVKCKRQGTRHVRSITRGGIDRARSHGLRSEYDIARFIDLMYILDLEFDTNPEYKWVQRFLKGPEMAPGRKMDEICGRIAGLSNSPVHRTHTK